ncbi:MAG: hypothetical protein M3R24_07400 [Chloroflexota bacterium]|nr:hypothetical protein [Chloroflexota bacterium]
MAVLRLGQLAPTRRREALLRHTQHLHQWLAEPRHRCSADVDLDNPSADPYTPSLFAKTTRGFCARPMPQDATAAG